MPNNTFALLIRTDGQFRLLDWPTDPNATLKVIYAAVDCTHFDAVHVTESITMWVDDEGLLNDSPANLPATLLYALHRPPHQLYHGHALFTGGADAEGNTLGLTGDQAAHLTELHLTARRIPQQRTGN